MRKMIKFPKRKLNIGLGVFFLITLSLFYPLNVFTSSAATNEFIGQYKLTAYLDGPFSGTTSISRNPSTDSLTTYFGTFSLSYITHHSDVRLSHSSQGYVSVSNYNSYISDDGDLIKSESTWSFHVSGYQQTTTVMTLEYGNYVILQNTESVYEETYSQRYYEDGSLQESVECRDVVELEAVESKTTEAGTFECARLRTTFYENSIYAGYSLAWVEEDGTLILNQVYDENGAKSVELSLKSESAPTNQTLILLILGIIVIGGGGVAFYIYRKRSSTSYSSQYHQSMTRSVYNTTNIARPANDITNICPQCGTPSRPLNRFCENCGTMLEKISSE